MRKLHFPLTKQWAGVRLLCRVCVVTKCTYLPNYTYSLPATIHTDVIYKCFLFICEKLVCFKRDQHTQSKQINLVLCIIRHIPSRYVRVHDIKVVTGVLG